MRLVRGDRLHIQAHAAAALKVGREDFGIFRPPCDFEAARMHPVQGLPDLLRKRLDLSAGVPDEVDHQVALTEATHHARSTGRGLRADLVLIEESDAHALALGEVVRRCGAEAAGPDHDDICMVDHDSSSHEHSEAVTI